MPRNCRSISISVTLLAVALGSSAATAEPLSSEETAYVIMAMSSATVLTKCDGYEVVENGMGKFGDQAGVDVPKFGRAILAAMNVLGSQDYERSDLIPEVTRQVRSVAVELEKNLKSSTKSFCKKWGEVLIEKGAIKRK